MNKPKSSLAGRICGFAGVAVWFGNGFLVNSWTRSRPIGPNPDTGEVYRYVNHGVLYITWQDALLTSCLICLAILLIGCAFADLIEHSSNGNPDA